MLNDLTYAVRGFARSKVTAAVLLTSLGLGTGVNALLYSIINALLFQPPGGLREPSQLVTVFTSQFDGTPYGLSSFPDYESLKNESSVFEALAAIDDSVNVPVQSGGSMQRVRVGAVSGEFFSTVGLSPYAGRLLMAGDAASETPAAVISFELWTAFGESVEIIGKPLRIGGREYPIAGIAPRHFNGLLLGRQCDVWIPMAARDRARGRGERRLAIVGRLARGTTLDGARREVQKFAAALAERYPGSNRGTLTDRREPRRLQVMPYSWLDPSTWTRMAAISTVVTGATGLLLLSACINAGSLLLSRSAARRRELAVKLALGADRRLLMRQILIESQIVSLAGAGAGLLLAYWTAAILPARFAPEHAELLDTRMDLGAAVVTIALACLAGALFAIGPSRHASQTIDTDVLRADAGAISTRGATGAFRAVLVTSQIALSIVLLVAAGVLVQMLSLSLEGDVASESRVAVALVRLPGIRSGDVTRGIRFHNGALQAAGSIEGAEAAGWVATLPAGRSTTQTLEFDVERPGVTETAEVDVNVASHDYFRALRIPLVEGRPFDPGDGALAKPVVIVNDILARRFFGPKAVGHILRDAEGTEFEIVGVVRSGRHRTFQETLDPMVYFALSQRTPEYLHLVLRMGIDPQPLLRALPERLASVDAGTVVERTTTFEQHLKEASTVDRLITTLVTACGLAALVLSTIGVYGVIDDRVRRRTAEIGLRVALGAGGSDIRRLVLREGVQLVLTGTGVGIGVTLLLARVARSFVDGVPDVSAASLAIVPFALTVVTMGATAFPIRRALRVSPTVALRAEP